jgi:hypothetical protein
MLDKYEAKLGLCESPLERGGGVCFLKRNS